MKIEKISRKEEEIIREEVLEELSNRKYPFEVDLHGGRLTEIDVKNWCKMAITLTYFKTRQKTIEMFDRRIEELENPTIICTKCKFSGKNKDYNYDSDAFEMTCPICNNEVYSPDYRKEIKELQDLKKRIEKK